MDLGRWLRDRRKQVEGVAAQVNPFDNGKTYASVTRRPTVDPFKSNNINAKYGVLADKGRRDQFIQSNQRESFSTPIATFQSLQDIPGKIGNTLINNPIADKAADITGTNRQTSVEGRNSSDYLKPTGVIDNTVAAISNLGQFNPIRSAGDIGQYLDTISEKSRFKPVGDLIGNQTKDAANFGKPIEGSEWDARNLKNPVARNAGEFSTMLGQTANFAVPVAGPLAIGGMVANEANELVNTARARGEDETVANLKGLLSGAGQAAVERYSSKLTTALPGSTKLAGLAKNKLVGIPASLAGGAITEGSEEFVQGLMGNAARGNDLTEGLKEQTIQGAKGGLLLGGFFGGANYAANRSQGTTQEVVQQVEQQNPTLQQTGIPAQPGSIRERIQQAKENVKSTIINSQLVQNEGGYIQLPSGQQINDNLYHGSPNADAILKNGFKLTTPKETNTFAAKRTYGDGIYLTTDLTRAQGHGSVVESILPKNAKIYTPKEYDSNSFGRLPELFGEDTNYGDPKLITEKFKKLGYDGIKIGNDVVVFDPSIIKTSDHESNYSDGKTDGKFTITEDGKSKIIDLNKKQLSGAAQQSQLGKQSIKRGVPQSQLTDTELMVKNYFENNPEVTGDATTGEGAKTPIQLDSNKKQSLLEKTRAAAKLLKEDQGGGYDGGRSATDRATSLKQEARKYKSAEEFVKAQGQPLYHGGTQLDKVGNMRSKWGAIYATENPTYAKSFGGKDSVLNNVVIHNDAKLADMRNPSPELVDQITKKIDEHLAKAKPYDDKAFSLHPFSRSSVIEGIKQGKGHFAELPEVKQVLKELGYDGQITKEVPFADNYGVWNKSKISTEKQLTDLYNQATKKKGFLSGLGEDGSAEVGGPLLPIPKKLQEKLAGKKSDTPLTDKAYAETFGVSIDKAKKDIASLDNEKSMPLDSVGMTEAEATKKLDSRAVTMSPKNKKTKQLVEAMKQDKKLTEAARIAQSEGKELNYFAKKDNNGRSVGIEEYNPSRQRIEAGFVVDNNTGKVLGNHIKVDATGTQINVGGEVVNISDVVGNPLDWKGDYEVSSTMERNIFKNAPNKEIAQKTYKFVVANKIQAEANLRKDIESQRKSLNANVKEVLKAKPRSVSRKDFGADIFDFIENKKSQADIAKTYGPKATQAILKYKNQTRELYDNLLDRANTELAKFGEKTIPKRTDYITHINELNQTPSFAGELMGQLQNSMLGEGYTTTRGGVPGDIAGRTETFSPRKRWNPFAQQRKGGEYTKDPFKAVDSYLEPTLYNIHMTESAVRARAVESAFRTAEILKNTEVSKVTSDLNSELEKYKKQSNNGKLVAGFQEYANALAGKTQRWDRQVIDASKGTATALKGWQGLQRIGGRATILGNVNSVLMQPLNQASVIAEVKLPNYIKGVASSLAGNNVEDKSPFIRARAAKIESAFRSKGQKAMDKAGVPLQFVELASVKLAWNAEYQQVLSEGLKGQDAIIEADRRTEKAVAGRGIADKPELYRSTLTNGLLQYTLEVNAQNKKFWRDLTPAQKGKFMVAAFGMNTIMEAVTGNEPLPDFIGATIDTFRDFMNDDDDTPLENAGKGVQRFASEAVSMNPMLSAGANLLPDSTKKTLFGSDSDLTRFEGVPAPIGVIQNAVDVGKNVANGDVKKARDSALKLVPGGNQIRKTLQGKELIQDGGKYDKNGKLQYPAPESPLGKAQALLFGPSATKNAREYYDSITDKISGISTKKDASGKEIDDFKTIATAAFGTEKGKEFMALTNDDERKEFARQSSENRGIYEQYKSMQKAFNGGNDLLPEGLSKESEAILNKYDRIETKTKEEIFYRENDAEYKYELAKYEKDKLEGTISEVDAIRKEKSLAKQEIGSKYEKGIRDVYSLSKKQIEDLVTGDPAGKAIYDKLVKYDKELYDAGLISYLKFKNGLASGRGGGGRGKKDTSLTDKYALQGQTLSRLQKLLTGTTFAGAETVTTPKTQKAKQKKITVNMKA